MLKVFKGLFLIIVLLVIIIAAASFYVVSNLSDLVKTGINEQAPAMLGVPVTVGSVDISLMDAKMSLGDLKVANPAGFSDANAFELKRIHIDLDRESLQALLMSKTPVVVVDRILIDGAAVNAEQVGTRTNLQVLKDKISKATASSGGSSASSNSAETPNVAIGLFEFTNAKAMVSSDRLGDQSVDIPSVTLNNIGSPEKGIPLDSAAQAILQPLMKKVISQVQKEALNKAVDKEIDKALDKALGEKAGKYKDALKGLFKR